MDVSEGYRFLILEDWYLEFLSTMHINIFFFESFPKGMAATKHISNIAYGLSEAGASVDLLIYHRAVDRKNDDGLPAEPEGGGRGRGTYHRRKRPALDIAATGRYIGARRSQLRGAAEDEPYGDFKEFLGSPGHS